MQFLNKSVGNLAAYNQAGVTYKELRFDNGESYRGGWRSDAPEGEGVYTWADGSVYEGSWNEGLKHGWGKYSWPNGAEYRGEWQKGVLQGYGVFKSPDGSVYQGGWQSNLKHGLGRKTYANGDFYEGLWRYGKAEGPGRYVWAQGNVYDGEWRAGKMHGQGTLRWCTGERYDGEWREGLEDGIGVFTWQDGSTYEGFWVQGKKEGVGVFRPDSGNKTALPPSDPTSVQPTEQDVEDEQGDDEEDGGAGYDSPLDSPSVAHGPQPAKLREKKDTHGTDVRGKPSSIVYVCEYVAGRLAHEEALSPEDVEAVFGPLQQQIQQQWAQQQHSKKRRLRRRGKRRRKDSMGETIFKGHRSYDLMLNLQLGIRYSLTTLSKVPRPVGLTEGHFKEKVWLRFPREGSEVTPPHPSNDFKWKDYCPEAFRKLRDVFGINTSEYLLSICGDQALRELPSPGKSGSVFFISHDDQYMIKTMRKEEIELLLGSLPKYVAHVAAHPNTMLLRFFGVHRVKPSQGSKVRFVVMNNVFRTEVPLHRKYDLKGSTHGRTVGAKMSATAIRKDLDLDVNFKLDSAQRARLMDQVAADCAFLEDIRVMDYSLLLGVHYRSYGDTSASPANSDKEDEGAETAEEGAIGGTPPRAASITSREGRCSGPQRSAVSATSGALRPAAEHDEDEDVVMGMMHDLQLGQASVVEEEPDRSAGSLNFLTFWRSSRMGPQLQQAAQQASQLPLALPAPDNPQQQQQQPPGDASSRALSVQIPAEELQDRAANGGGTAAAAPSQPVLQPSDVRTNGSVGSSHTGKEGLAAQQQAQPVVSTRRSFAAGLQPGGFDGATPPAATAVELANVAERLHPLEQQQQWQEGTPAGSPHAASTPGAEAGSVGEEASSSLVRWRSNAVQLPDILQPPSNARRTTQQQQQQQQQPGFACGVGGQISPASGPSVIAQLPQIPKQVPRPVGNGIAIPDEGLAAAAAATPDAPPAVGAPASPLDSLPATPNAESAGECQKPRRRTLPAKLTAGSVEGAAGSQSAPSSLRGLGTGAAGGRAHSGGWEPSPSPLSPGAGRGPLDRSTSAPPTSFAAYNSAGVKLKGGVSGLVKCGPPAIDAPASFRRMATIGARVSGGVGTMRRPDSNVDLSSPEAAPVVERIRRTLERPVSDRLMQDLLKLGRYKMLGQGSSHRTSFRAPTMVLAARSRRNTALLERMLSEDDGDIERGPEQPGLNLPALAVSRQGEAQHGAQPEEVVLFCGIIDFLQEYNLRKRLEHNFKSVVQDGKAISVVEPKAYSKRFQKFLSSVFIA